MSARPITTKNHNCGVGSLLLLACLMLGSGCTWTAQVSVSSGGTKSNGDSVPGDVSPTGRYIAFSSRADNLVANDTNSRSDIFVRDAELGTTTRVSVDSAGNEGNDDSYFPTISDDGRYVAFWSEASNLVANDTNNSDDVFVHDRDTGITTRVSVDSAGNEAFGTATGSTNADISFDGRYVVFRSEAANLVINDTNATWDIFLHDRNTGMTTRISVDGAGNEGNGISLTPTFSGDALFVTYVSSSSNLVPGDTNNRSDVFVFDRTTSAVTRASIDSNGGEANGSSARPVMDGNGRHVVFYSFASSLVADDTQLFADVFVHDRDTGLTERVSVDSNGAQSNASSSVPTMSADGRYITFASFADNLVANDNNGDDDVFLHDRSTGVTSRLSVDKRGDEVSGDSDTVIIAAQARYAAFRTEASDLVPNDNNNREDVVVKAIPTVKVSGIIPNLLPVGATTAVTISGANFFGNLGVVIDGAIISNFVVVDENTITADVTVPVGTVSGAQHLSVLLYGEALGPATGSAAICGLCVAYF